jgi:hypothetical protein
MRPERANAGEDVRIEDVIHDLYQNACEAACEKGIRVNAVAPGQILSPLQPGGDREHPQGEMRSILEVPVL